MESLQDLSLVANDLVREALDALCQSCGAVVAAPGAWGDSNDRRLSLADGSHAHVVHDEREAPYDEDDKGLLVSLTDEKDVALCAWARPRANTAVCGIGIDLASTEDFAGRRGERFNHLLFSAAEQGFVRKHYAGRHEFGFAYAFSAKEAGFKCLAAPLRTWYESHDEEFIFDVREFELADATHERGTLRHARAQRAMDAMGVTAIELFHRELDDAVLTLALSLAVDKD